MGGGDTLFIIISNYYYTLFLEYLQLHRIHLLIYVLFAGMGGGDQPADTGRRHPGSGRQDLRRGRRSRQHHRRVWGLRNRAKEQSK